MSTNYIMSGVCYDECWLRKDMENMGYLFEYCDKYFRDTYNIEVDKKKFINTFMRSRFRVEMERGHERMLSQSALDSLKMFISVDCQGNAEQFKQQPSSSSNPTEVDEQSYAYHQFYWVGWMYAYLHFREKISSKRLIKLLPLDLMLEHYHLGHEMSKEVYYEHIKHIFSSTPHSKPKQEDTK